MKPKQTVLVSEQESPDETLQEADASEHAVTLPGTDRPPRLNTVQEVEEDNPPVTCERRAQSPGLSTLAEVAEEEEGDDEGLPFAVVKTAQPTGLDTVAEPEESGTKKDGNNIDPDTGEYLLTGLISNNLCATEEITLYHYPSFYFNSDRNFFISRQFLIIPETVELS